MTNSQVWSYKFKIKGDNEVLIDIKPSRVLEDLRPRVGDLIKHADFPTDLFKVVESVPAGNPAGQAVTYILEYDSDRQLLAGGSIPAFPNYYLRAPWRAGRATKIY